MKRKAVVIGSRGMLGQILTAQLIQRFGAAAVFPLSHSDCDITDAGCSENPVFNGAEVIFNCAAYTNVDGAEAHRAGAFLVNETGTKNLAVAAARCGAVLVQPSTDFVFDGKRATPYPVDAPTGPLQVYGASKLAGENVLAQSPCRNLVVRTSWLYGPGRSNFVEAILARARTTGQLKVVSDQLGSPTYTGDLAEVLIALWLQEEEGTFHFSNSGVISWYQFACDIVKLSGLEAVVEPCSTEEYPTAACRPRFSALDLSLTEAAIGNTIRSWKPALVDYLAGLGLEALTNE